MIENGSKLYGYFNKYLGIASNGFVVDKNFAYGNIVNTSFRTYAIVTEQGEKIKITKIVAPRRKYRPNHADYILSRGLYEIVAVETDDEK